MFILNRKRWKVRNRVVSLKSRFDGSSQKWTTTSEIYIRQSSVRAVFFLDFQAECVDREIEIVQELLDKILRYGPTMEDASSVCAELDCLLSFAEAARAFDYRRPRMVEDPVMDIVQGRCVWLFAEETIPKPRVRHPLQEQIVDTFVPNDARIVGGVGFGMSYEDESSSEMGGEAAWSSVILCTGANACGKVSPSLIFHLNSYRYLSLERLLEAGKQKCMMVFR